MLTVRKATEADRLELFKCGASMHAESDFRHFSFTPEKAIDHIGIWLLRGVIFVVEDDGQIVGMLCASVQQTWFSEEPFVREDMFFVTPAYRGTRAAFKLMRAFMQWVRDESGCKHVFAGAATGRGDGAERLYSHFGMHHTGGNYAMHFTGGNYAAHFD